MRKVIIDSNLIFSALKGKASKTRNILLNGRDEFFTPNYLIGEIFKHKERILKNSKASEEETHEYLFKILTRINFINEANISTSNFIEAYRLCKGIDEKDTPFVALSLEMGYEIWTRDQQLKNWLRKSGFDNFYNE